MTYFKFTDNGLTNLILPKMKPLRLSSLPTARQHEETGSLQIERDGFVDDEAVLALLNGPTHPRSSAYPEDLVLAADDLDFAGWRVASAPMPRPAEVPPQVIDAIIRRAAAPSATESGIGSPHTGSHRWWLAGLAGALSTLLFSVLLVSILSRQNEIPEPTDSADFSRPAPLVMPVGSNPAPGASQDLTSAASPQP